MTVERVDSLVAGAGVVGLAIARALSLTGREVLTLEAEREIVSHASARNLEVINAGYYAPGSLEVRACLEGTSRFYRFCAERGLSHRRLGKLIVSRAEDELKTLQRLNANALRLDDLEMLSA